MLWTRKFASCRSFLIDCSKNSSRRVYGGGSRETREGWPLLTVETEANGDSTSTYERGPFLVGSLGWLCQYKWFLSCLGFSSRPSTKYFFLTVHCFMSFFHIIQQAGQAAVPRCLSLNMCLWWWPNYKNFITCRIGMICTIKPLLHDYIQGKNKLGLILHPFTKKT